MAITIYLFHTSASFIAAVTIIKTLLKLNQGQHKIIKQLRTNWNQASQKCWEYIIRTHFIGLGSYYFCNLRG